MALRGVRAGITDNCPQITGIPKTAAPEPNAPVLCQLIVDKIGRTWAGGAEGDFGPLGGEPGG